MELVGQVTSFLWPIKDDSLKTLRHSNETCIEEHQEHIRFYHLEK
jgi:hypothetical protein